MTDRSGGPSNSGICIHKGDPIVPRVDIPKFLEEVEKRTIARQDEREKAASAPAAPAKECVKLEEFKPEITYDDFVKIDLRIATILSCERIQGTDKLVKMQIDLGIEQRQIVAGIAKVYTPEELVGKQIVVVANLAPRKMRGELSRGMLLATGNELGVTLLKPEKPIGPGETVHSEKTISGIIQNAYAEVESIMPRYLIAAFAVLAFLGCAQEHSPVAPSTATSIAPMSGCGTRSLWGLYDICIDTRTGNVGIVPLRGADFECNVVNFLQPPKSPTHLLTIVLNPGGTDLPNGKVLADVSLRHPFRAQSIADSM